MVFLEYGIGTFHNHGYVYDKTSSTRRPYRTHQSSPMHHSSHGSLEEEINRLRSKMEQAFLENESLTAEIVVEISRLLDDKINEYMKRDKVRNSKN